VMRILLTSVMLVVLLLSACAAPTTTPTPTPAPITFTLSTSASPIGAGSISPSSGQYEQGAQVNVTAIPSAGYAFSHWSGDISGSSPSVTITMDSNKTLVAHFADIAPPVISEIGVINVTESGATITWTTNEPATSQIKYGLSTSYYGLTTRLDTIPVINHEVNLSGLEPNTTYYFRVKSKDAGGNEASLSSEGLMFTTLRVVTEQWISPIGAVASGYTKWGETWYTGPPEFAIDGNNITAWTLNDMGELIFDLGGIKTIKGIEAYWGGHVTNGNTVNVFVDGNQVLFNERFGATSNKRYFDPIQGRYIKYQTVPLPHNEYLQVATWSEIAEFRVLVESE